MDTEKNFTNESNLSLNKRDEIILVAAKLFRSLGYVETSMKEIADRVNILKGSLYYHFSSKEELLNEVVNKGIDRLLILAQQVYKQYEQSPRKRLKHLVEIHILHLTKNNDTLVIANNQIDKLSVEHRENYISKRNLYENMLRETLEEGIRVDEFPPVDAKLTVLAILGTCNWIIQWYKHDGPYSAEHIADYFSNLIFDRMLAK